MKNPFTPISTSSPEIIRLQDNVSQAFQTLSALPITNQVIVKDVLISTTDTMVNHGLARPITGFLIINKNAATDVYQSTTTNSIPSRTVILVATVQATVTILFF